MMTWGIAFLIGAVAAWVLAMLMADRKISALEAKVEKLLQDRAYLRAALLKSREHAKQLLSRYRTLEAEHTNYVTTNRENMMSLHWEVVKAFEASKGLEDRLQQVEAEKLLFAQQLAKELSTVKATPAPAIREDPQQTQILQATLARLEAATEKIETLKAERELLVEHSRYEIGLLQENVMHTNERLSALVVENQDLATRAERLQDRVSSDRSKMQRMRAQLLDLHTENSTLQASLMAHHNVKNTTLDGLMDQPPPL